MIQKKAEKVLKKCLIAFLKRKILPNKSLYHQKKKPHDFCRSQVIEGGFLIPKKGGDRVKVRVIKSFYDRSADMVLRKEGSEFEADGGRATELKNLGFVEPLPKPEKTEKPEKPEKKTKSTK